MPKSRKTSQNAGTHRARKTVTTDSRKNKSSQIIRLLERPHGATLNELLKATGWQPHSIRGFLSGTLKKKMALKLQSSKRENGDRAYQILQ